MILIYTTKNNFDTTQKSFNRFNVHCMKAILTPTQMFQQLNEKVYYRTYMAHLKCNSFKLWRACGSWRYNFPAKCFGHNFFSTYPRLFRTTQKSNSKKVEERSTLLCKLWKRRIVL